MVLLVLAIVWAAVLASWLRSRIGPGLGDSVGSFRRHLTMLERAAPSRVAPAHSMRAPGPVALPAYRVSAASQANAAGGRPAGYTPAGNQLTTLSSRPASVAAGMGTRRGPAPATGVAGAPSRYGGRRPTAPSMVVMRRRRSQKRRRDVLVFLLAAAVGTLLLGAGAGIHTLLYANVIFDLMLAAYVALLIRMRNLQAEREMKLTFLPPVKGVPAGMVLRGTGRYASMPSYNSAASMDTGELVLNRAAN